MRYAVTFLILGPAFAVWALYLGGWGYVLLWPAVSATLVGIGYAGAGARVFGKRRDGRFPAWAWVIHAPYLLITWAVWHLQRAAIRESPVDQVAPGLWVGRRPLCHEVPPACRWIVDLTAELWTARGVCGDGNGNAEARQYVCHPMLDGHVADDDSFVKTVREIAALEGELYVHCAQGHGRSAALAAALLIARGLAGDADEAERKMIESRARVWLNRRQRALVRRVTPLIKPRAEAGVSGGAAPGAVPHRVCRGVIP